MFKKVFAVLLGVFLLSVAFVPSASATVTMLNGPDVVVPRDVLAFVGANQLRWVDEGKNSADFAKQVSCPVQLANGAAVPPEANCFALVPTANASIYPGPLKASAWGDGGVLRLSLNVSEVVPTFGDFSARLTKKRGARCKLVTSLTLNAYSDFDLTTSAKFRLGSQRAIVRSTAKGTSSFSGPATVQTSTTVPKKFQQPGTRVSVTLKAPTYNQTLTTRIGTKC